MVADSISTYTTAGDSITFIGFAKGSFRAGGGWNPRVQMWRQNRAEHGKRMAERVPGGQGDQSKVTTKVLTWP